MHSTAQKSQTVKENSVCLFSRLYFLRKKYNLTLTFIQITVAQQKVTRIFLFVKELPISCLYRLQLDEFGSLGIGCSIYKVCLYILEKLSFTVSCVRCFFYMQCSFIQFKRVRLTIKNNHVMLGGVALAMCQVVCTIYQLSGQEPPLLCALSLMHPPVQASSELKKRTLTDMQCRMSFIQLLCIIVQHIQQTVLCIHINIFLQIYFQLYYTVSWPIFNLTAHLMCVCLRGWVTQKVK